MVGYGVRVRRAATAGEVLVSVETREAYIRAGNGAYAILFGTILLDSTFGVLPREHLHDSLFYIGILPHLGLLVYYRYMGGPHAAETEPDAAG